MRVDYFNRDEEVERSQWFKPTGEILAESKCSAGTGYDIQLHENGSLKLFVSTQAWLYNGTAVYFNESGVPISYSVFSAGKPGPKVLLEETKEVTSVTNQ